MDDTERRKRKEEAKLLKRKRIEDAGGVRPRSQKEEGDTVKNPKTSSAQSNQNRPSKSPDKQKKHEGKANPRPNSFHEPSGGRHRFGRVMERVPCRNQARFSTLSIALPGSVVSNCQTRELKTQLVGQIARAAAVYHVDEIIVFDDKLATEKPERNFYSSRHGSDRRVTDDSKEQKSVEQKSGEQKSGEQQERRHTRSDPHTFMARVLQYCECPQYLRRHFFPMHPDLQFAGLLCPIDAPHHVRAEEKSKYREGVVLEKKGTSGSLVNCGIRGRPVE